MNNTQNTSMIFVNGSPRPWENAPLRAIIETCLSPAPARGVAVALNGAVVPRSDWDRVRPADGDRLDIVRPMAGG